MSEPVPPPEHHHTADDLLPARLRRFIPLLAVAGISAALVGYLTGIREPARPVRATPVEVAHVSDVPHAVTYSELPVTQLRPRATGPQTLAQLKYDRPGVFEPVLRTDEMKLAALADRAKNRAFDGAPPTIPHHTWMRENCTSCHGLVTRPGTRTTHPWLINCTQCHAPSAKLDQFDFSEAKR